jgi:membrane protein YqaA with SNARE-associated domain
VAIFRIRRIPYARIETVEKMLPHQIFAIAAPTLARSFRRWIINLGALGFIPLGLLDSSVIPVPGSMDVLTIILSARKEKLWPLYAVMATIGSVIGAYVTYRVARKGGEEALKRRFPAGTLEKVQRIFDRWGYGAIVTAALLPPPMPLVPFVFAAGAMQYSAKKFVIALSLGRLIRYSLLAFLAALYGRQMIRFISRNGHPNVIVIVILAAVATAVLIYILATKRKKWA